MAAAYNILLVPSEYAEDFARSGYDDMGNTSGAYVEFDITDIAQSFAVPAVYNFFFPQFTNTHSITIICSLFIICRMCRKVPAVFQKDYSVIKLLIMLKRGERQLEK